MMDSEGPYLRAKKSVTHTSTEKPGERAAGEDEERVLVHNLRSPVVVFYHDLV